MSLPKITTVSGTAVYVPGNDIDTDRIIPARFMKCITFDGLGEYAFHDERFDADGNKREFALNRPEHSGASILLSGENFGCGSSREHAPQSLYHAGFRAIIAESFAEIFFGNSTQIGIVCIQASREDIQRLGEAVMADPQELAVTIDVATGQVTAGDIRFAGAIPAGAQTGLLEGRWDPIAELLEGADAVNERMAALPYTQA